MSLRYRPDPDALAGALAGRIDTLEQQLTQHGIDVAALGRGVAGLTTQIRDLSLTTTLPTPGGGEDGESQPDWHRVSDPDEALHLLTMITRWVGQVGAHHGISLTTVCWPLHPDVVADLIALMCERETAYLGTRPTPVSEWLTRWLPAAHDRIRTALARCTDARGHHQNGHLYDTTGFDPLSAGRWWATDRHIPAPEAFALTHLD